MGVRTMVTSIAVIIDKQLRMNGDEVRDDGVIYS